MKNMETADKKNGERSMCGGMCRQHHWMHIIIKILVALFIFWVGVQFGELKGVLRGTYGNYGYGMMGAYTTNDNQGYYGRPAGMMNWFYGTVPNATTTQTR